MASDTAGTDTAGTDTAGSDTAGSAAGAARDFARSHGLRHLARVGLAGYGVLHLLVAWLVAQLAYGAGPSGNGGRSADQAGAMTTIARSPVGPALLCALAVGLAGLAVWQAVEFLRHHRHLPHGRDVPRAALQLFKTVGTAVFYGYLAVSAVQTAFSGGRQRGQEQQTVQGVLSWPGGQVLVVGVGVVTAGIGVYLAQKGLRSAFRDEIDLSTVRPALRALAFRAAQAGFVLKGLALVLVGGIVGWAAATFDPSQATGLDGALRGVVREPFGRWVLGVVALGLVAFSVYCFARARHPVG